MRARLSQWNTFTYEKRDEFDVSPKFSLQLEPNDNTDIRFSVAKAVRYPLVSELFIGDPDQRNGYVNNPELKPAEILAKNLLFERSLKWALLRLLCFTMMNRTLFSMIALLSGGELRECASV